MKIPRWPPSRVDPLRRPQIPPLHGALTSTSDQFCLVLRAWQCPQRRSSRSRTVKWLLGPVETMVVVETGLGAAGLVGAARVEPLQRRLLQGVGPPPQMGHPHQPLAPGHHRGQERVVGVDHVPHRGDRHRPEAGDLAHLSLDRIAPQQRPEVDPYDDLVRPRPAGRLPPRTRPGLAVPASPAVLACPLEVSDPSVPSGWAARTAPTTASAPMTAAVLLVPVRPRRSPPRPLRRSLPPHMSGGPSRPGRRRRRRRGARGGPRTEPGGRSPPGWGRGRP